MKRVDHEIWAEQDEKSSRLMLRIGDDKPVTLIVYDRTLPEKFNALQAIVMHDGGVAPADKLIGTSYRFGERDDSDKPWLDISTK